MTGLPIVDMVLALPFGIVVIVEEREWIVLFYSTGQVYILRENKYVHTYM